MILPTSMTAVNKQLIDDGDFNTSGKIAFSFNRYSRETTRIILFKENDESYRVEAYLSARSFISSIVDLAKAPEAIVQQAASPEQFIKVVSTRS